MNEGADIHIDLTLPTMDQLAAILPRCDLATWHRPLISTMGRWHLVTPLRQAVWLAQIAVESSECTRLEEGLTYTTPERLAAVYPSRFPSPEVAVPYIRNPRGLASHVYANRNGNGPEASGDGWTYRGRGLIQVTFKANYAACGAALGLPLEEHPELLLEPEHAAQSAGWYWDMRKLNPMADTLKGLAEAELLSGFRSLTRRINAGLAGMSERIAYLKTGREVLDA